MSKASGVLVRLTLDTGILDTQNTRRAPSPSAERLPGLP
jgi:hypothetical protein